MLCGPTGGVPDAGTATETSNGGAPQRCGRARGCRAAPMNHRFSSVFRLESTVDRLLVPLFQETVVRHLN